MRIAYGVNGYGRGHAMRAAAVVPELARRGHDVLVLAGGDAYDALSPQLRVKRVPNLRYLYGPGGRLSNRRTLRHNLPMGLDLRWNGTTVRMVADMLEEHGSDIVVSDGEAFSLRAAQGLGLPRISLDNFAQLAYCDLRLGSLDRVKCWGNALGYRLLLGVPDRIIISSFFDAPPRRPGIRTVGPILRREVRDVRPTRGDYLLAYISIAGEYTSNVERAFQEVGCPVRVYGTTRRGTLGCVEHRPLSNTEFVESLAGCRAVYGTTGNTLMCETIHLRKPMLGVPIDCMEQRINAIQLERMGVGMAVERHAVTAQTLRVFLSREGQFLSRFPETQPDGLADAVAAIEAFADELHPPHGRIRRTVEAPSVAVNSV